MREYAILKLENNIKYIVIDIFETEHKKYFLITRLSQDELSVDKEFKICIYNETKNFFEQIQDDYEYDFIMSIFEKRLENQRRLEDVLKNIKKLQLKRLRIIDINNYDYLLESDDGKVFKKNIEFYIENKPKVNDYIYMSENIIKEQNIFEYGVINNFNQITSNEIIKLDIDNEEYYLQRYYG